MSSRHVKFTFPQKLIPIPVVHELGNKFEIVTNIRRTSVLEDMRWGVLEIEGDEAEIENRL